MDLDEFLKRRFASPDHGPAVAELAAERKRLEDALKSADAELSRHRAALAAIDELRKCDAARFFSSTASHRFFVVSYAALPDERRRSGRLVSLECVIVPEAVIGRELHRPHPHEDPAQAARGVVTMTPTPVPGPEIAADTAARYASGVRLGTYADVRIEPCGKCGKDALVVCEHAWDHDSGYQGISVELLCTHCPLLKEIASECWDADEASTILPPKTPPRRRY